MYNEEIKGKTKYTLQDTFMGFHCGNTCSKKLAFCEMKYQKIMARALPIEVTNGTLKGDIAPDPIIFYRLQSTADNILRIHCTGWSSSSCFTFIRINWCIRYSRNEPHLPPLVHRKGLPTPRCRCIRPLWKGTLRSIQVHRRRRKRDWIQPASWS